MRTIRHGLRLARRKPLALVPIGGEAVAAGVAMALGAFPSGSGGVASAAVFPLDLFFDLKQSLALAHDWSWFALMVAAGLVVRSAVLGATLWLSAETPDRPVVVWGRALKLGARATVLLFPSAGMFFLGVAARYAPFIWAAALLGILPSAAMASRAVRLDAGDGRRRDSRGVRAPAWLTYALLLTAAGAALSGLATFGSWAAAAGLVALGPLNGLVFLGWRDLWINGEPHAGGTRVLATTACVLGLFAALVVYDRVVEAPRPLQGSSRPGTLLLIGGVDSTSTTGALTELDPRALGWQRRDAVLLSYRGDSSRFRKADTRGDLGRAARLMAGELASEPPPRALLGHSQAALILDRILDAGMSAPDRAVVLAPVPPRPPPVEVPPPGQPGAGRPGGDFARFASGVMEGLGGVAFKVDVPASPTNLDELVVEDSRVPRLAVWALGDSVWLDGDWRRPGEETIVALTDHVGVTRNAGAIAASARFLAGRPVDDSYSVLKSAAATLMSYLFAPWRPV